MSSLCINLAIFFCQIPASCCSFTSEATNFRICNLIPSFFVSSRLAIWTLIWLTVMTPKFAATVPLSFEPAALDMQCSWIRFRFLAASRCECALTIELRINARSGVFFSGIHFCSCLASLIRLFGVLNDLIRVPEGSHQSESSKGREGVTARSDCCIARSFSITMSGSKESNPVFLKAVWMFDLMKVCFLIWLNVAKKFIPHPRTWLPNSVLPSDGVSLAESNPHSWLTEVCRMRYESKKLDFVDLRRLSQLVG